MRTELYRNGARHGRLRLTPETTNERMLLEVKTAAAAAVLSASTMRSGDEVAIRTFNDWPIRRRALARST